MTERYIYIFFMFPYFLGYKCDCEIWHVGSPCRQYELIQHQLLYSWASMMNKNKGNHKKNLFIFVILIVGSTFIQFQMSGNRIHIRHNWFYLLTSIINILVMSRLLDRPQILNSCMFLFDYKNQKIVYGQ